MHTNAQLVIALMFFTNLLAVSGALLYRWRMKSAERRIKWKEQIQVEVVEKLSKEHAKEVRKLLKIISGRDADVMALNSMIVKMDRELADKQYRLDRAVMNGSASAHLADYRMQKILGLEGQLQVITGAFMALNAALLQRDPEGQREGFEAFMSDVEAHLRNCRPRLK